MMESRKRFAFWIPGLMTWMLAFPVVTFAQTIPGTFITTANVKVRQGPGTSYQVVTTIPKDIKVNVVGKEGNWLQVESKHGGKPGYVERRSVEPWRDR